jgi:lysozyme
MRQINIAGIALIKGHEALELEACLGADGAVKVGYGHTGRGIRLGSRITEEEAERLLSSDLAWIEEAVSERVRVELSDNEFSALVSLVFDIGIRRFSESALLKMLNKGERGRAAEAMLWLDRADSHGLPIVFPGLSTRRSMEKALFLDTPKAG